MELLSNSSEPNYSDNVLRGRISSQTSQYYIINELLSLTHMKLLTGVKLKESDNEQIGKNRFSILYINKNHLKKTIFRTQALNSVSEKNIYQNLKSIFISKSKVKHTNIQDMLDFCETDDGLYYVMEYCDMPLYDYLAQLREFCMLKKEPIELKIRYLIGDVLNCIGSIHDQGLQMSGLIDIRQIFIQLKDDEIVLKFLHPILASIFTLLKIYTKENDFPSFFSPEVYTKLANQSEIENKILKNDSIYSVADILMGIQPLNTFDYWSAGILFYEMLFGKQPHKFNSLKDACDFNENKVYTLEISAVTFGMLQLITMCLKYQTGKRFNINSHELFLREFHASNQEEEEIEKEIKRRKETYKEGILKYFNYVDDLELGKSR